MNNRQSIWILLLLVAVAGAVLAGLYWANYRVSAQGNGGSRFIVYWAATRAFAIEGASPYSAKVAAEVEAEVSDWARPPSPHERKVVFPLYAVIFYLPFALIGDYFVARAAWMTLLEVALLFLAFHSARLTRWRPRLLLLAAFGLFALLGLHTVTALIEGNAIILVALLVVLAFNAIRVGMDEVAGALLALSTMKPAAVLVIVLFVLFWSLAQRRWRLIAWFFGCILLFSAAGMFFVPDWPFQYVRLLIAVAEQFWVDAPTTLLSSWWPGMGEKLGQALSAVILAILLLEWWLARAARDFNWFLWTACLSLAAGQWVGLPASAENFVLLLLPLALIFSGLEERWKQAGRVAIWAGLLLIFAVPWLVHWRAGGTPVFESAPPAGLLFLLPLFTLVGLYWVRWWMVRPKRTLLDEMRARGDF